MTSFIVTLFPDIPDAPNVSETLSIGEIDAGRVLSDHPEQYEIIYRIGEKSYRYYPTSILTILNDLYQELDLVRSRQSHPMTLSGYTVLEMEIDGEAVMFYDPLERLKAENRPLLSEPVWVVAVEEAFRRATEKVLSAVQGTT